MTRSQETDHAHKDSVAGASSGNRSSINFATALLLVSMPAIACRKIFTFYVLNKALSCSVFNSLVLGWNNTPYNRGVLAANYLDHGFVRRGLGGTLLKILAESPLTRCADALIVLHMLSAIWIAVPLVLLARHVARRSPAYGFWLIIILVASPQFFWAWSNDLGRTDMLTGGCIAWSVLAVLHRRHLLAGGAILFGTLAHESTAIFGLPLLFVLWVVQDGGGPRRAFLRAAMLAAAVAVLTVVQVAVTTASPSDLAAAVLQSEPPSLLRDAAAYMTSAGARSIVTSWCQSFGRPATWLYLPCLVILISLYAVLLAVKRQCAFRYAIATIVPTAAISLIAMDYGRWLNMATLNAWLFAAAVASVLEPPRLALQSALFRLGGLLFLLGMKPISVFSPSRFADLIAVHIWGKEALELRSIDQCDPNWRASIGLPPQGD